MTPIDLPWMELVRSVRCPACRDRIGVPRIGAGFVCPHCKVLIKASPVRALIASMGVGTVLLALTAWWLGSIALSVGVLILLVLICVTASIGAACIVWHAALGLEARS